MNRDKFINNKFITVAGRAGSMEEFAAQIKRNLYDNFNIVAIHGLGEFGIDDKERYLAFITGESEVGATFTAQEQKLVQLHFGAHVHNTLEDAYDYSKANYPSFGEEEEQKQRKFEELSEKFPAITAKETEDYAILESLMNNGRTHFVRAVLDGDNPCLVLVTVSSGGDEIRVRPLAIMMNHYIESMLEFPNPEDD